MMVDRSFVSLFIGGLRLSIPLNRFHYSISKLAKSINKLSAVELKHICAGKKKVGDQTFTSFFFISFYAQCSHRTTLFLPRAEGGLRFYVEVSNLGDWGYHCSLTGPKITRSFNLPSFFFQGVTFQTGLLLRNTAKDVSLVTLRDFWFGIISERRRLPARKKKPASLKSSFSLQRAWRNRQGQGL